MEGVIMKKSLYLSILIFAGLCLFGCDKKTNKGITNNLEKKEIIVGLPPSMHNILMERVVKPELEKKRIYRSIG
jgi:D-methionine transport system substrate-binding protein